MANKIRKIVQNNIKKYRLEKGLTQLELALESSLTESYISKIERNLAIPSITSLVKIARALDVEPYKFFIK